MHRVFGDHRDMKIGRERDAMSIIADGVHQEWSAVLAGAAKLWVSVYGCVRSSGSACTRRIDKGKPGKRLMSSEASWIRCRRAKVATLAQRPESLDSLDRAAARAAKSAWLRQPGLQSTAAKLMDKQRCSEARALERGQLLTKEITPDIRVKIRSTAGIRCKDRQEACYWCSFVRFVSH